MSCPLVRRRPLVICLSLLVSAAFAQQAASQDAKVRIVPPDGDGAKYWSRWRGPSGQGLVESGQYVDQWSDKENVLWKTKTPGAGNSSPITWGDRLFLTTAYEKGAKRSILCFDRRTGVQLWESFAPAGPAERVYGKNGWATCTVTTDGERVYAYFGSLGILCVDLDGKQVWHTPVADMNTLHGSAGSPLLHKDLLVLYQEMFKPTSYIAAFDKRTGKEVWRTPRKSNVGWGSPLAITVEGKDQIIVSSQHRVIAYDPADGKEIWSCAGNTDEVIPSPVVGLGLLICCSGRRGPTIAIRPENAVGDITKTHVVWKIAKESPFVCSPLLYGERLFTVNDMKSIVQCFDAKTGKELWQHQCGQELKEGFSAASVGVNGKVFFTNDLGETYVLKNSPTFELLHVNKLNEKTLASPALVDNRWYLRSEKHLWCIGAK
jgi:outer membrane protein assembly factor BamB